MTHPALAPSLPLPLPLPPAPDPAPGACVWTVLGAGTASPHVTRSPSGHLVTWREAAPPHALHHILVDMGPGTLGRLIRAGVRWQDLDALVLSHAHLDHTLDLQTLCFASCVPGHGRTRPLPVWMGPGMMAFVDRLHAALGRWFEPRGYALDWREVSDGHRALLPGGLTLDFAAVDHHPTSLGLRVTCPSGASAAYSSDSAPCTALTDLCRAADWAFVECSTPSDQPAPGHLTPATVADLLHHAQPRGATLIHRYPEMDHIDAVDELRALGLTLPIVQAEDGARWHSHADAPPPSPSSLP